MAGLLNTNGRAAAHEFVIPLELLDTPGYTRNCSGSNGGRHAAGATVSTTRPALTTTWRMPSRARSRVALG